MDDLQQEMEKRKAWFFECQLRRLNLDSFRDIHEPIPGSTKPPDPLLDLVSEQFVSGGFPLGQVGNPQSLGRVYLDSQQPVWTIEEREQRNKFAGKFIGKTANWLNFKVPVSLAEKLAMLKKQYEDSKFSSNMDIKPELNNFGREDPSMDPLRDPLKVPSIDPSKASFKDRNRLSHAISRVAITEKKPWLIPEIFNNRNIDTSDVMKWIENGETFISNYESEMNEVLGVNKKPMEPFSLGNPSAYRKWIGEALKESLTVNSSSAIKVQFLDKSSDLWRFNIKIQTPTYSLNDLKGYTSSDGVKYWTNTCINALEEIYVNKADSDMGLCLIIRTLYLYGTLPPTLGLGEKLRWRNRKPPDPIFHHFFAEKAKLIKDDPELMDRLLAVQTKLQILLEQTADSSNSGAIHFSPLAQEILKQDILSYKFWMDEPFSAYHNAGNPGNEEMLSDFNRKRKDIGKTRKEAGRDDLEPFTEKEYWSENHYIMFASSEYLAGQLWENETFQAAKDFLTPAVYLAAVETGFIPVTYADTSIELTGKQRMERGKARVLKWLDNKLMFGWTEFNSSGYYREHLMALLNLVDFSMDEDVRTKANIVTDLLFFDLLRFSHKGSMGAAGGRSQFKSKCAGWDNALGDVVEILLGNRGVFLDQEGDIGCSFATSTYKIPDVLLQIANFPPSFSFIDRSRVSLTFDEAAKYGIQYSKKSSQQDSIEKGFAPKRRKHFNFLKIVNDEITRTHNDYTHTGYGAKEDDTVFWWTMSAYFNKEVVKNTFELIDTFGLRKCEVFDKLYNLIKTIVPLIEKTSHGLIGAAIGSITSAGAATIAGAALGFFSDDILDYSTIEEGSDDLSFFLEGSTRTRANILTYRNRDVMLSSLQNFRTGQFNFQTNVNQATLNTSVNIFTTAAFSGLDLSSFETGFLGGVLGGAASGGFAGALLGAGIGVLANEVFVEGENLLATHGDGPGWWTGYWALPMVIQHESAAIIAYDFNTLQKHLADVGSHVWFPKNGFDQTEERRTSAYEDDNFFLLDITDIGPKGFWLFGKIVHKKNLLNPDANEEAYIGVFSNQRPEWLNYDSDFYKERLKKDLEISVNTGIDLFVFSDYFADKDWYRSGKNIWIMQVGNKEEFGSFDNFKDRVGKAKIVLDDAGDMECSYAIPKKNGASQTLSLKYGDGGEFSLDGKPFESDLYPRFENPFVRGGRVEWGQREYVIEYNGKSLIHDFSNMERPVGTESEIPTPEEADTLKALVIYLKTGDEEMRVFTVATATVNIGCEAVAVDEVIAAGQVDTNTIHDVEWIFFDKPGLLTTDMTIEIKHPATSDGDDDPEWKMSFSLKALMGNHRLYDCALSFTYCHFKDEHRSSGALPFTVQVSRWRNWQPLLENATFDFWQVALQPGYETYYYDYFDLLAIDANRHLLHRKVATCATNSTDWKVVGVNGKPLLFNEPFSLYSLSTQPANLFVFAVNNAELFYCFCWQGEDFGTKQWISLEPQSIPTTIFGLPDPNAAPIPVPLSLQSQVFAITSTDFQGIVDLYLSGADGNFYSLTAWYPGFIKYWRKIKTSGIFTPLPEGTFRVCANHLFVLDNQRRLWVDKLEPGDLNITPSWVQLTGDSVKINSFVVAQNGTLITLLLNIGVGEIHAAPFASADQPVIWERVGVAVNFLAFPQAKFAWAIPREGHLDIFTTGQDGKIYTTYWEASQGWETNHNWFLLEPNSQTFTTTTQANIVALNRVKNQLEIVTQGTDLRMWKTWWT